MIALRFRSVLNCDYSTLIYRNLIDRHDKFKKFDFDSEELALLQANEKTRFSQTFKNLFYILNIFRN